MNEQIVVIGSLNLDYVINLFRFPSPGETVTGDDFAVYPGGKGANQAFAAARLGAQVWMIGQVGNDPQGDILRQNLESAGVDTTYLQHDKDASSGIALITIDASGQNQIIIVPGSNGTFTTAHLSSCAELIAGAGLVLLQLEIPIVTVQAAAEHAHKGGALVMLDPAPAHQLTDELLSLVDYLTPNETELATLTGVVHSENTSRDETTRQASELLRRGAKNVIVKMGARGALLVGQDENHFWPAVPVAAVDTTAAGDAFNGAFAVALASGKSTQDAGRFAAAAAACSVTRKGAQASMPTRQQADELLNG